MKHCCPYCMKEFETSEKKAEKQSDPNVKVVIKHYGTVFKNRFGSEPVIKWGAYGTVAKRLLTSHDVNTLTNAIESYLASRDKFFEAAGYPFLLLPNFLQKQAVQKNKYDGLL